MYLFPLVFMYTFTSTFIYL